MPAALKVVLAGGGTTGHIAPMIATAQALAREVTDIQLSCIGTARGLETSVVPAAGLELDLVEPVPMPRKPNLDLVKLPARLVKTVTTAAGVLRRRQADVVVGFGGYPSVPPILAARLLPAADVDDEEDYDEDGLPTLLGLYDGVPLTERDEGWSMVLPDRILLYADDAEAALDAVTSRGLQPVTSLVRRSSLEDVFLHLTGRTLVD